MCSRYETLDTVHLVEGCTGEKKENGEWIKKYFIFPLYYLIGKVEK